MPGHGRAAGRTRSGSGTRGRLLLLLPLAAACGPGGGEGILPADGVLRVGFAVEPPFAWVDSAGAVTGEAPAVMETVARELGASELRWVRMDFDELLPALVEGRVEAVATGLFATPERALMARLSIPTYCADPALLVASAVRAPPASMEEVVGRSDLRLAVFRGSVEEAAARGRGIPEGRLLRVPDLTTGLAALRSGAAQVMAMTLPTARHAAASDRESFRVAGPYRDTWATGGCGVLAFRPDMPALAAAADCVLASFLGTPQHRSLVEPFGLTEEELPPSRPELSGRCGREG